MNKLIATVILLIGLISPAWAEPILINGAGATFPYPIYSKWFDEYAKINPDLHFNYQSIGSGGGIRQASESTVDFGATDGPMNDEQMSKAKVKLLHFPTVLGADVPVHPIDGAADVGWALRAGPQPGSCRCRPCRTTAWPRHLDRGLRHNSRHRG